MRPAIQQLLTWLFLVSVASSNAADNPLTGFNASYDLFRNDKQVGESFFRVEKRENQLNMRLMSKPSGLYATVTDLQPVTETTLIRIKGDYHLSRVKIFANPEESPHEIVDFNWQKSSLTAKRKNGQYQLPLTEAVYDYLSIHWLAAQMALAEASQLRLKFYRKGRLMDSTLSRKGTEILEVLGKSIEATVFEHSFDGSSRRLRYHYDQQNPWLPLRIERSRKDKKTSVLLLKSVEAKVE